MPFDVVTPPAAEPLTSEEARLWLKEPNTLETPNITRLITSGREWIERQTNRCLVSTAIKEYFPAFSEELELQKGKVSAVSKVEYYDADDVLRELSSTVYEADTKREPAVIRCKDAQVWPITSSRANAVQVTYTAGYGGAAAVPERLKTLLLLYVSFFFENRQAQEPPKALAEKLISYRIPVGICTSSD